MSMRLLQKLAEYLNLELEIVLARDVNDLIPMLLKGEGDLIAHGLTVTNARKKKYPLQIIFILHVRYWFRKTRQLAKNEFA